MFPNHLLNKMSGQDILQLINQPLLQNPFIQMQHVPQGKQQSATQINKQIIAEVKQQMQNEHKSQQDQSNLPKCDMHPRPAKNCRKCRQIKEQLEALEALQETCNQQEVVEQQVQKEKETYVEVDRIFPIWGDITSYNVPQLLRQSILNSMYFKEIFNLQSFYQVLEEVNKRVTHVEPWAQGASGHPSTAFCCLYKLLIMRLTVRQVHEMFEFRGSPNVRCLGALYIRFVCDPEQIWSWYNQYIQDEEGMQIIQEKRKIRQENLKNISLFQKGTFVKYFQNEQWKEGALERFIPGKNYFNIRFLDEKGQVTDDGDTFDITDVKLMTTEEYDEYQEKIGFKQKRSRSRQRSGSQKKAKKSRKDDSKSRSRSRDHKKKHKKNSSRSHDRIKRSRSNDKKKRSRSTDRKKRSRSNERNKRSQSIDRKKRSRSAEKKNDKSRLIDEVRRREQNNALSSCRQDYAKRPTSYKSSLSNPLQAGGHRVLLSRSPSPIKRTVKIEIQSVKENYKEIEVKPKVKQQSNDHLQKLQQLLTIYGDASSNKSKVNKDY